MLGIGILSLHRGSDAKNLSLDGRAQAPGEEVRLFERFPACGGFLSSLDRDLPEEACRNSCLVGEATHLIGCTYRNVGEFGSPVCTICEPLSLSFE